MRTVRARIGKTFCLFSLALYALKIAMCVINKHNIATLFTIDRLSFLGFAVLFGLTAIWENKISKLIQIVLVLFASIASLCASPCNPIWGIMLIIMDFLLCYIYDFFDKYSHLKLVFFGASVYMVFLLFPLRHDINRFVIAFEWTIFICIFIFVLWIIFKDYIEKIQTTENKDREKYLYIIEEATSVARDALDALEKLGNKRDGRDGR